jgi:hypothetical protein
LPHTGVFEFSAEAEGRMLEEYRKIGRIDVKDVTPDQYFSAFREPEEGPPKFNPNMPEL